MDTLDSIIISICSAFQVPKNITGVFKMQCLNLTSALPWKGNCIIQIYPKNIENLFVQDIYTSALL